MNTLRCTARTLFWVILSIGPTASEGWSQEPTSVRPRLEAFASAFKSSAAPTRRRLLADLRQELEGTTVLFTGSAWSISEVQVGQSGEAFPNRGARMFSWEYAGMIARPDVQLGEPAPPVDRIRRMLGGAEAATLVIVLDGQLKFYALTADPTLVDRIRPGIEIELTAIVSGMSEDSLFGFLVDVADPRSELQCTCGHQFPAETGFLFCPFCGKPLRPHVDSGPSSSSTQIE